MKVLKLLGVFLLFVGGIFLALNWNSLFTPNQGGSEFGENDKLDISKECEKIRKALTESSGWNENLYNGLRDDIEQSKGMGLFSRDGYNTVNNCLRESATNKVCDGYKDVMHTNPFTSTCEKQLSDYYKGVQFIKKQENLSNDNRIGEVENLNRLYANVQRFIKSSHRIVPEFDTSTADWKSFSSLQSGILSTARSYRTNSLFKEMSHIPGFQDGLNEEKLTDIISKQRKDFYEDLSQQIIRYFEAEEPTTDKINLLNQIYKSFTYQESDYGVDALATLKVNYGQD